MFWKIKNITPPSVSLDDLSYVTRAVAQQQAKFQLKRGDVLIALTGSHINQMSSVVGRVARVQYDDITLLNQRVGKVVITNPESINLDYVYYFLSQDDTKLKLATNAGGAANQANISPSDIKNLKIPFPPIEVQNHIADILSAYDNLIENNQKQIRLLEEAARRLYKEWFVDFRFPGHESVTITDGVPQGWKRGVLSDIAYESGKNETKANRDNYKYYLPIDCLPKASLAYTVYHDISEAESSLVGFCSGDILFGALRPYFHKVAIARDSGLTRSTCFVFNSYDKSFWAYLVMLLFSKDTVDYATQISVGTTMPYTRWKDFRQMPIVVPAQKIAQSFSSIVCPFLSKITVLSQQIMNATEARNRLLPVLMNGETEV